MSDEEFYIDDDVRRWKQRGLSQEDAQIEAEWERTPDLTGINIPLVDSEAYAASRAGESGFPFTPGPLVRIARKPIQRSEVQQLPGGLGQHEKGAKLDAGKAQLRFLLYFRRSLAAVADLAAQGAFKYTEGGFLEVEDGFNRYTDAMLRHLFKELETEYVVDDPEWIKDVLEATAVAWNALARLEIKLINEEK